jgi:hypothetical protein
LASCFTEVASATSLSFRKELQALLPECPSVVLANITSSIPVGILELIFPSYQRFQLYNEEYTDYRGGIYKAAGGGVTFQ